MRLVTLCGRYVTAQRLDHPCRWQRIPPQHTVESIPRNALLAAPLRERFPTGALSPTICWSDVMVCIKLSSYALMGLDAVPVDVIADGDWVRVVDPETGRCIHFVRLDTSASGWPVPKHVVNIRAHPDRNLAPAKIIAQRSCPISPYFPSIQTWGRRNAAGARGPRGCPGG
jgi:hypothetical protein